MVVRTLTARLQGQCPPEGAVAAVASVVAPVLQGGVMAGQAHRECHPVQPPLALLSPLTRTEHVHC